MTETRTVTVEREFPHAPEKLWRALTQPHLLEEWLMKTDFRPETGAKFTFSGEWGAADCEVLEIEPHHRLVYRWDAFELRSIVTLTLTETATGTRLRMEQSGFTPERPQELGGARYGWENYFGQLEQLLDRTE
ncbi:SRPBCC family protein [Pelagovum pacificum]|uniref:SRPBCC domain-containing protein n=1 Tax=Pelagovum pacificum TaxID=2588711 RepID=A0A5C5GAL7_9RHOB|nr:SRPBCC domain-containing protein [Pelagovum pacificum]QQA41350.1 SRPBCC domain-containing protein [Pelagovum pacificum]TNY31845.1 SRPBCC domain-containing protein [Pelagovum pacificum]